MTALRGLLLGLGLTICAGPAFACLVCIGVPERTMADRVLEDAVVVLARQDPENAFRYAPDEVLRGEVRSPIPFLVDSRTRRRLGDTADLAVLVTRESGEGDWRLGALVGPELRAVIADLMPHAGAWAFDPTHPDRFAYFATHHDSDLPVLRQLALAEISRAPYALIRGMTPRLDRAEIVKVLLDPVMVEWAPIHILMLGLSGDDADRAFVRAGYARLADSGLTTNLGAWATALIEVDGLPAVDRIDSDYLGSNRSATELREIVRAYSTQAGAGDPALRARITQSFRMLARTRPEMAAEAAKELIAVQDWSLADVFAAILASDAITAPEKRFAIDLYLAAAREAGAI